MTKYDFELKKKQGAVKKHLISSRLYIFAMDGLTAP